MNKLDLDKLDKVNGGFREENSGLPTSGKSIRCPKCHAKASGSFSPNVLYDPKTGSVEYKCKCGCKFVCVKGRVILKEDYINLCNSKGIKYPFQ